jgi:hypothetical protein
MSASDSEKKIVVDDDWKSRVDRERQSSSTSDQTSSDQSQDYPEASFELLVTTFSMQAMAAMGVLGGPGGAQQPPDLGMAKHLIDLLGVIEEKTRGNLSQDEASMLEQMLHQLRVLFIDPEIRKNVAKAGAAQKGKSSIELS